MSGHWVGGRRHEVEPDEFNRDLDAWTAEMARRRMRQGHIVTVGMSRCVVPVVSCSTSGGRFGCE